jgi:hypothetical protein
MLMKAMMGGLAWERETKDLNTVLSTTCSPWRCRQKPGDKRLNNRAPLLVFDIV